MAGGYYRLLVGVITDQRMGEIDGMQEIEESYKAASCYRSPLSILGSHIHVGRRGGERFGWVATGLVGGRPGDGRSSMIRNCLWGVREVVVNVVIMMFVFVLALVSVLKLHHDFADDAWVHLQACSEACSPFDNPLPLAIHMVSELLAFSRRVKARLRADFVVTTHMHRRVY